MNDNGYFAQTLISQEREGGCYALPLPEVLAAYTLRDKEHVSAVELIKRRIEKCEQLGLIETAGVLGGLLDEIEGDN